jgi:hypothetical protein
MVLSLCLGGPPPSMFEVFIKLPTPVGTGFPASGLFESQPGRRWIGDGFYSPEHVGESDQAEKDDDNGDSCLHGNPPFTNNRQKLNWFLAPKPWWQNRGHHHSVDFRSASGWGEPATRNSPAFQMPSRRWWKSCHHPFRWLPQSFRMGKKPPPPFC